MMTLTRTKTPPKTPKVETLKTLPETPKLGLVFKNYLNNIYISVNSKTTVL